MFGECLLELENWKECDFQHPIEIYFHDAMPIKKFLVNYNSYYFGVTYHLSLDAAKKSVRSEYAVKKTPRFKWIEP